MTLKIVDAAITGFEPGNDAAMDPQTSFDYAADVADYVIPADDILGASISERAQKRIDTASFTVENTSGKWVDAVSSGDRVTLWLATSIDTAGDYQTSNRAGEPDAIQSAVQRYGETAYGQFEEPLYTSALSRRWTGRLTDWSATGEGGVVSSLQFKGGDYVYQRLADRRWVETLTDRPIAGSPDAILNTALRDRVPELDRTRMVDVGGTTDVKWNFRTLLDLLKRAIDVGGAVAAADHMSLVFRPIPDLSPAFEATHTTKDWYGDWETSADDADLRNNVRVIGATEPRKDELASQETVDTRHTVGGGGRLAVPITSRKARMARVGLWTDPPTDSAGQATGDDMSVRVQVDDGGAPVAPSDTASDIVSADIPVEDMTLDGWTEVEPSDGVIPGRDAWLLIETSGSDTQTIGGTTDGSGNFVPGHRTYFPVPLKTTRPEYGSINQYRVRDALVTDENIRTLDELGDFVDGFHSAYSEPHRTFSCTAWSDRLHSLGTASVITVDAPRAGLHDEEMVCTERTTDIQNVELTTELTFEALDTL